MIVWFQKHHVTKYVQVVKLQQQILVDLDPVATEQCPAKSVGGLLQAVPHSKLTSVVVG